VTLARPVLRRNDATALASLAGLQVLFTLFVLVRSPHRALPGLPRYRYDPLDGDAYGYYSAVRELLATWRREGRVLLPLTLIVAVAFVLVWRRTRNATMRALAAIWACGIVAAVLVERIRFTGAPQIGWPLVWSIPLLPYRAVGLPLSPNIAFAVGLVLSLACNVITIVMTYALARLATQRWEVPLIAAALMAFSPVLILLDPRHTSAMNGTWQILLGLAMYTEPLSTALVLSGLVVAWRRSSSGWDAALAGALLGLGTLVRISNALIAACVILALLARGDRGRAFAASLGGIAFLPAVALFWPKGYPKLHPPVYPAHPFELRYIRGAWTDSLLWHPSVLVAIVPIAIVGILAVRRAVAPLLVAAVAVTCVFYSFYQLTPIHPRFLFVVVPVVFVLWAAGASAIGSQVGALYHRPR
jgi:hypothetical protein